MNLKKSSVLFAIIVLLCGAIALHGHSTPSVSSVAAQGPPPDKCRPRKETCNNLDDDCDGQIDEGVAPQSFYTGPAGSEGVGVCHAGTRACSAGSFAICRQEVTPGTEICGNLIDEDCDGQVDETECTPQCTPSPEICDGIDNDCDGQIDESGCACTPTQEICDGVDNDCDGQVDEDVTGAGETCQVGVGACTRSGTTVCQNGQLICNATPGQPTAEICGNGLDDDCDGQTDEGCPQR